MPRKKIATIKEGIEPVEVSKMEPKPQKARSRSQVKGLSVDVVDTKGKVEGVIELPKEFFGAEVNAKLLAQAVRVYRANQRTGTASTKTRGEVSGSTRKIYRQKGTGRARHGSIRAPIFVHGGIVFGPKPRDHSLKLTKNMRKKALACALSARLADKRIRVISGLEKLEPKTKSVAQTLKILGLQNASLLLVLPSRVPDKPYEYETVGRSARNIEGVTIRPANQLNTYEVLQSQHLLFTKSSIESLEKSAEVKN